MRKTLIGLAITFAAVTGAMGQGLTEAEKRREHVSSVRAATDCIAREVVREAGVMEAAREGRLYDVLAPASNRCLPQLNFMISEHDRIYGYGTGLTFFQGPYVDDLARAVLTRIGPDLQRLEEAARHQAIERANQQLEAQARIETAERTRDLLRDRMYQCTGNELSQLVRSSETAEVLAEAAMTICSESVRNSIDAAINLYRLNDGPLSAAQVEDFRREVVDVITRSVRASAVQARASANTAAPAPSSQAPTTQTNVSVRECLVVVSEMREGRMIEEQALIDTMLDICRPEIETAAREAYLNNDGETLAETRRKVLGEALIQARSILNVRE